MDANKGVAALVPLTPSNYPPYTISKFYPYAETSGVALPPALYKLESGNEDELLYYDK